MTREEVVALMESSKTEQQWNNNCDRVKTAFGGDYPGFWYEAILQSGVARTTLAKFGRDDQLHIYTVEPGESLIDVLKRAEREQ